MLRSFRSLKSVVDWVSTAITVVTWLGLTTFFTGVAVAVGGSVWSVLSGVPLPLAIMAGFAVFASAVQLTLAPMIYRALKALPAAQPKTQQRQKPKPIYTAWGHIQEFSIATAACLWCEIEPNASYRTAEVSAWQLALVSAAKDGDLELVPEVSREPVTSLRARASESTKVTRQALRTWADKHGYDPVFLRPANANSGW